MYFIKNIFLLMLSMLSYLAKAQNCITNTDLDAMPGKYLTAAQYPWPAARADYFKSLTTTVDKSLAKKILGQIELLEQQSRSGFNLTGGNWENTYNSKGYSSIEKTRLAEYSLQSAQYEFFCNNGKQVRNTEYSTVLRFYVNTIPTSALDRLLQNPFGSSMGEYDFGFQFQDWKNHKPVNVNDPLINFFNYFSCNNEQLIQSINTGNNYFQDVAEKDIKPNNRNTFITRYWFARKNELPLLVPVTRKEYLQNLLEYYEREKLYFPKLVNELTQNHSKSVQQYNSWETDVTDKINTVKKVLEGNTEEWLQAQAIINKVEDNSLTYKAGLKERTNYNRFWKFYNTEKKSEPLYKYNTAYFNSKTKNPAQPQFITIVFRYVSMPSSLRLLNNFTEHFDFKGLGKLMKE